MTTIIPLPALNDNYIWMMVHPDEPLAAVVDPGDAKPVIEALKEQQLTLTAILITHHHWDHTNGISKLLEYSHVPVYGPANDPVHCSRPLKAGDKIYLDELQATLKVLDIPGHTLGHIAYVGEGLLFSGDTLFTGGCGKVLEGTASQMHHSLSQLAALPSETLVYCGHEYTEANLRFAKAVEPNNPDLSARIVEVAEKRAKNQPTVPAPLGLELKTNPFLRCHIPEVIESASKHVGQSLHDPVEVFAAIRSWKNEF